MRVQDSYNPLGNCISLVQTLGASRGKNRKLFWGCVQTECTKMCSRDYQSKLNIWELLGAMQALSVYILIRLDEGKTEDNNLDFLFLAAVTVRPFIFTNAGANGFGTARLLLNSFAVVMLVTTSRLGSMMQVKE